MQISSTLRQLERMTTRTHITCTIQRRQMINGTRSVAAGYSQQGMPPPASNDTGHRYSILFPELRKGKYSQEADLRSLASAILTPLLTL